MISMTLGPIGKVPGALFVDSRIWWFKAARTSSLIKKRRETPAFMLGENVHF
jgi:hypothetical protein